MKVKSGFKLMKVGVQNLVVAVDERGGGVQRNGPLKLHRRISLGEDRKGK